ncbi:hypothetical protein [Methyloligella solikamskensis]|uniref:Uncharacterized protein n=1 Tax=Methyloligella solikamskensis TaxID=1177756 RepID=A0ABW3JBI3_9HYPH
MSPDDALSVIPDGLRNPLLTEYESIVQNYVEHRWKPSELSGGHFSEIVYTILDGYSGGTYASQPTKPPDFVGACRRLEQNADAPRSFQILIPRLLPALYEVRNNRGVGHTGGDVDPNHMDATFVLTSSNWVMSELVRVYHSLTTQQAQQVVDGLVERRIPLVWEGTNMRRVLDPKMNLRSQVLVLLATSPLETSTAELLKWTGYQNPTYFKKLLRDLHRQRLVELSKDEATVQILPPGSHQAGEIVRSANTAWGA